MLKIMFPNLFPSTYRHGPHKQQHNLRQFSQTLHTPDAPSQLYIKSTTHDRSTAIEKMHSYPCCNEPCLKRAVRILYQKTRASRQHRNEFHSSIEPHATPHHMEAAHKFQLLHATIYLKMPSRVFHM